MRDEKYQSYTDHDLLIATNVKLDLMDKQFTNHLQHHWAITIGAISAAFMGLASFVVGLLMLLLKT
jgi:hypothetical protein